MSIKSYLFRKAAEREERKLEKGDYGPEGKAAMGWIKAHKAIIGTITAAVAGGLHAVGQDQFAAIISTLAGVFLGGGLMESDKFHKDRQ